jgi:hypothetical protein
MAARTSSSTTDAGLRTGGQKKNEAFNWQEIDNRITGGLKSSFK